MDVEKEECINHVGEKPRDRAADTTLGKHGMSHWVADEGVG